MKRTLLSTTIVICTVIFLAGLQTVNAEFIGDTKDSADFTWCYEMNVDPTTQDLDGNTGVDWKLLRGGVTVNGDGTITLSGDTSGNYGCLISGGSGDPQDIASHVWQNISDASGFTVEIRIQTAGEDVWQTKTGGCPMLATDGDTSEKASEVIAMNELTWYDSAARITVDSNANNDDFHTFRIAQNADDDTYYVWRDGELIVDDQLGKTTRTWNRLQIGDALTAAGPHVVDYIRVTGGAFAPESVPEPSTIALLATGLLGLLAYAWRKRK